MLNNPKRYFTNLIRRKFSEIDRLPPKISAVKPDLRNSRVRINLLLPGPLKNAYAGGYETAIVLACSLARKFRSDIRFLSFGCASDEDSTAQLLHERYGVEPECGVSTSCLDDLSAIDFRVNDIWLCTFWTTAYALQDLYDRDMTFCRTCRTPMLYLVQDYEPNFYPNSTESVLSRSTYNWTGDWVGVFNSTSLRDYFLKRHEGPGKYVTFPPLRNDSLYEHIDRCFGHVSRNNRIVIYGRPGKPRNAFGLVVNALRVWSSEFDSRGWEVVSVGEPHRSLSLGNGLTLRSAGFLSLKDYAELLCSSRIGISMMLSPHPSYPPFEMALAGLHVITNNYEDRVWEGNELIHAVSDLIIKNISGTLVDLTSTIQDLSVERMYYGNDMGTDSDIDYVTCYLYDSLKCLISRS